MPTATAIINLDIEGPGISRHLYGHVAEHLGRCVYGGFWVGEDSPIPNEGGIRLDVVEALRALRVPNLVLVSLSNLDADEGAEVTLDLRGGRIGEARARILAADRLQAHNTPRTPEAVAPGSFDGDGLRVTDRGLELTLPPHSFVTVQAPMSLAG
ncbi:hypothetical protein ABB07_35570 [Streptomyces incarnatus]|uniref:Alpha-L-arabinofuranosidase C-terminal domain-containing protein n=1 Tax=Streptomyces incarnatus TaxID=665007 RepID=A0ABM5TVR8_9ACTN|nr:alpha-L-arabinofuranosidase C-terminal domain-containing protein [Streptomyces incarnatus]AKJ15191.1 hypothetical protein ABB07_35570 [Streptomyces incarnatus]